MKCAKMQKACKMKEYATPFTRLEGFRGYCMVGVHNDHRVHIYNIRS